MQSSKGLNGFQLSEKTVGKVFNPIALRIAKLYTVLAFLSVIRLNIEQAILEGSYSVHLQILLKL